jgi:hypothetical protein
MTSKSVLRRAATISKVEKLKAAWKRKKKSKISTLSLSDDDCEEEEEVKTENWAKSMAKKFSSVRGWKSLWQKDSEKNTKEGMNNNADDEFPSRREIVNSNNEMGHNYATIGVSYSARVEKDRKRPSLQEIFVPPSPSMYKLS